MDPLFAQFREEMTEPAQHRVVAADAVAGLREVVEAHQDQRTERHRQPVEGGRHGGSERRERKRREHQERHDVRADTHNPMNRDH